MKKITIRVTEEQSLFLESNAAPNAEIIREALNDYMKGTNAKKAVIFDVLNIPEDIIAGKLEVGAQYRIVDIKDRITVDQYDNEEEYEEEKKNLEGSLWIFNEEGLFINGSKERWNLNGVTLVKLLDPEEKYETLEGETEE